MKATNSRTMTSRPPAGRGPSDIPKVGIVVLSSIADDPRVRRQGDAFAAAGWSVTGVGLPGARSPAPAWTVLEAEPANAAEGNTDSRPRLSRGRAAGRLRRILKLLCVGLHPALAERVYWTLDPRYRQLYEMAAELRPDLWLANDWTALPIAQRLAREQNVPLVYDTHELASDEYPERLRWRLLQKPFVIALERHGLRDAALATCVSDGIADRLQEIYRLEERPLVVRNTPAFQDIPFRPTGARIEVLYHGVVSPGRGLEECVRSVALWRPEFRLTIRGPASEEYRWHLEREIARAGVGDRVRLAPPVPMIELVREASAHDVGLFALPGHSRHNLQALPNKLFEYAMAGLALCVSDLPEMARLVRTGDLGVLIRSMSADAIAEAVNALDRAAIDRYKRNALDVAREMNWECESRALLARCRALIGAA